MLTMAVYKLVACEKVSIHLGAVLGAGLKVCT